VTALEGDEEDIYDSQSSPEVAAIAADEREHARIWQELKGASAEQQVESDIASRERWHRSSRSGTLRAVIFGVSDGLVSNLALVMGVAGAAGDHGSFILLAGIAGLLAGSFSMAAGEYISMQSQRELFERQIALERAEMEAMPEEEEAELAASYRAKGFTGEEAATIAHRIFEDPDTALDMLVREELGLDPDELGSPWGAAGGSFVAFVGDEIVGYAGLMKWDGEPTKAEHGLTVVRRDWRRRGLAIAIKQRSIAWAAANGIHELVTWTQTGNENMQAVNARLGYVTTEIDLAFARNLPLDA